ncbi:MAG: glycosyltransferase, partial [Cyanobacteriota bacterium]|nr:glycosyltransferase [Cyanobacteriota bacterium]
MNKPLVTVLVVTYNHLNTFEQAIKSVLEQKTNFEYKIWVLDDCSTDGTTKIVKRYAKDYPDKIVPIIRDHNLGAMQNVLQALEKLDTK